MSHRVRRGLMLLAPWLFARAAFTRAVVARSPRQALARRAYLAVYAAVGVGAALAFPLLLVPVGIAGAGATLVALWYARSGYGAGRGLPPGRLPLVPVAPIVDHEFYAREAARLGPVFKTASPILPNPTVCVVGLPRGLSLLRTHEDSLCPIGISFDELIPRKLLRHMAPDDHRRYRRVFQDAFRDEVVDACLPEIEPIVADGLAGIAEASAADASGGVAPRPYLEPIVLKAFLRLFLGLAPDSPGAEHAESRFVTIGVDVGGPPGSPRFREVECAADELACTIRRQGAAVASLLAGGEKPSPSFLSALLEAHPTALDDPTVTANLVFLLRTAATDVTGLLHWIVKMLGEHPAWIATVRESPDAVELSQRVVMETLRLEQSELIFRTAREEIVVDGHVIPAGWHLRVCVRESHQDPVVFPEPKTFDPSRFERRFNRNAYSPLGALGHTCLGARTIHVVAGSFVRQLAGAYELTVASEGRPDWDMHWRPGPGHRIVLQPRATAPPNCPEAGRLVEGTRSG